MIALPLGIFFTWLLGHCTLGFSYFFGSSFSGSFAQCPVLWFLYISPASNVDPDPGIKAKSLVSPALAGRFFTNAPPRKPQNLLLAVWLRQLIGHRLHSSPSILRKQTKGKIKLTVMWKLAGLTASNTSLLPISLSMNLGGSSLLLPLHPGEIFLWSNPDLWLSLQWPRGNITGLAPASQVFL